MANLLTSLRLVLVFPAAAGIAVENLLPPSILAVILCLAIASDFLDGKLARARGTALGAGPVFRSRHRLPVRHGLPRRLGQRWLDDLAAAATGRRRIPAIRAGFALPASAQIPAHELPRTLERHPLFRPATAHRRRPTARHRPPAQSSPPGGIPALLAACCKHHRLHHRPHPRPAPALIACLFVSALFASALFVSALFVSVLFVSFFSESFFSVSFFSNLFFSVSVLRIVPPTPPQCHSARSEAESQNLPPHPIAVSACLSSAQFTHSGIA